MAIASRSALRPAVGRREQIGELRETRGSFRDRGAIGVNRDQPAAAGDRADVAGEVLHFVADRRPVERALMGVRQHRRPVHDHRRAELERALHRDGLARTVREHPGDRVGERAADGSYSRCPNRNPTSGRRAAASSAASPTGPIDVLNRYLPRCTMAASVPAAGRSADWMRASVWYCVGSSPDTSTIGDVPREEVHDVGAGVGRVEHDAARILAADRVVRVVLADLRRILQLNPDDVARVAGIERAD